VDDRPCSAIIQLSVDHEIAGRSPKSGERVYTLSPDFGYFLNIREVLVIFAQGENNV
jgi:hypothetical protein